MEKWVSTADVVTRLGELGIDTTPWTVGDPSKLDKVILEAQRYFERKTKRKFEQATITVQLDGHGKSTIVVPYFPIVSITSIKFLSDLITQEPLTVGSYRVENSTGRIHVVTTIPYTYTNFPEGELNIEVNYTYGYEVEDIPEDIQDCIVTLTVMDVVTRTPADWEKLGQVSRKIGDYSESFGAGKYYGGLFSSQKESWLKETNEIISRFKRIIIV